jgi:Uma2 family endonuclease
MSPDLPRAIQEIAYDREAREYLESLPPEHFMEANAQATQRKITLESLDLLQLRLPSLRVFNEMLVQYPKRGQRRTGKVVPDNMVVLTDQPIRAELSYNVPLEPAPPFWSLEYVSKGSRRKDYEDSFRKYERELKVPYYLVFYTDAGELTLYRHNRRKYVTVKPSGQGRHRIPELELEVGLLDGWVRFWYRGELLPLPADMQRDLDAARRQAEEAKRRAEAARREAETARRQAEEAKRRADELQRRLEAAEHELSQLKARRGSR